MQTILVIFHLLVVIACICLIIDNQSNALKSFVIIIFMILNFLLFYISLKENYFNYFNKKEYISSYTSPFNR